MARVIFENHNVNPVTGDWINYRFEKGTDVVEVSVDGEQTWVEVPATTAIYNESDFARWIYGFKAGLIFMSRN